MLQHSLFTTSTRLWSFPSSLRKHQSCLPNWTMDEYDLRNQWSHGKYHAHAIIPTSSLRLFSFCYCKVQLGSTCSPRYRASLWTPLVTSTPLHSREQQYLQWCILSLTLSQSLVSCISKGAHFIPEQLFIFSLEHERSLSLKQRTKMNIQYTQL